ncbi:MAG: response regulator [Rhodobacteraceae bacterium]|nr:response regulator [Paracoccaceae bacterium]
MDDRDPFASPLQVPTANRPLLGLTVLVVEDSRYASEAMRLLCLRSGARIRRADCLKSARRHLQTYRPAVVIVDLGLPDGSGISLIEELAQAAPRMSLILGTSGDDGSRETALAAGADGFLSKPITSLAVFQQAVLRHLPPNQHPRGLHLTSDDQIHPDKMAFHDDMAHVADVLSDSQDEKVLDYVAQFLGGVARSIGDNPLAQAADDLAHSRAVGAPVGTNAARIAGLVHERLQHRKAI